MSFNKIDYGYILQSRFRAKCSLEMLRKPMKEAQSECNHPLVAVCIRTSIERPEALEAGDFILSGITADELLQATSMAVEMKRKVVPGKPCPDYVDETVLMKVVRII